MHCDKIRDFSFIGSEKEYGEFALLPLIVFNYLMSDPADVICYKVNREAFYRLASIEGEDAIRNQLKFGIERNAQQLNKTISVEVFVEDDGDSVIIAIKRKYSSGYAPKFPPLVAGF